MNEGDRHLREYREQDHREYHHDALVYFGRRISRQTLEKQVYLWGRVIRGMGLKEGDELLLFGPTLPEFIYSTYNNLLEGGWRMREIDDMDLLGFLRIRAWNAKNKREKQKPRRATIDTVWPGLKP